MNNYWWSVVAGLGGFVLFLVIASLVTLTTPNPRSRGRWLLLLVEGADGRLSTSKFQWFAWTSVIAGTYCAVFVARALVGHTDPINQIPNNVLLALGFSTTTMAAAKGITTSYVAQGRVLKEPSPAAANSQNASMAGGLLTDDAGITDLSKVQLLTFTLIALAVYVYSVDASLGKILADTKAVLPPGIPDIDSSLMVLMGLSQGGYLGKKLTSASPSPDKQVVLLTIVPGIAQPGQAITLYGANFGSQNADSYLTISTVNVAVDQWSDAKIVFKVPNTAPAGGEWSKSQDVAVGVVVVGGIPSTSTSTLTVKNPKA